MTAHSAPDTFPGSDSVPGTLDDPARGTRTVGRAPTPAELLAFALETAADATLLARLETLPQARTWFPVTGPAGSEAWVIGWPPGAETGWHDHGGSIGAFAAGSGRLLESSLAAALPTSGWTSLELLPGLDRELPLPAGSGRAFGPHHLHQVVNPDEHEHAISVHVYYPPLPLIRRYRRRGRVLGLETVERPNQW